MQNPFKLPKDLDDDFYYDEGGVIRGFEKSIRMGDESIEQLDEIIILQENIREKRKDMPFYNELDNITIQLYKVERHLQVESNILTGMHIQSCKSIVALEKIMKSAISEISNSEKSKELRHLLDSVRKQLNDNQTHVEELKKHTKFIKWWEKVTEDSKGGESII